MPDTTPPPVALSGDFLTAGMTYCGRTLRRVALEWEGGKLETELPTPAAAEDEEPPPVIALNNYQRKVVLFFADQPADTRLRGDQIAAKIKEDANTLRKHLAGLKATGVLDNDRNKDGYCRGVNFTQALDSIDVP